MRIIKVSKCEECPCIEHDNGGGYCEPFNICNRFNILLDDKLEDGTYFYIEGGIHPKCQLEREKGCEYIPLERVKKGEKC